MVVERPPDLLHERGGFSGAWHRLIFPSASSTQAGARSHRLDHTILGGHDIETAVAAWIADYNAERPHSSLKYQTPAAYAATFTATGDRLRNPDQLRRSPVAPPAPLGVQNPETLTAAG
ncbi:integrase core domain-containing protein [Bradyrhizobium huanghuaihaiense]